ncbi:MAG: Cas10/Cmr2 second palm domain-containing protein [Petrimonas sp.]|jgi:CRISPR-associated protein Cmr2
MKTYTALTIGPIYDTFTQAKLTRSIWAASYFFSLFIRKILEQAISEKWEILLPYDKSLNSNVTSGVTKGNHGAGLYADRLYFINKSKSDVQVLIDKTIGSFAADMFYQSRFQNIEDLNDFLSKYLNVHIVEISLTEEQLQEIKSSTDKFGNSNNSVLKILNDLLDNKELNKKYAFEINKNPLIEYFATKWNDNTALKKDAFGIKKGRHFKSIAEISTSDLLTEKNETLYNKLLIKDFKNEDVEFIDLLKNKLKLEDYHKYYAVLYADGDNIGALLRKVANNEEQLKTFSKLLLKFGLDAEKSINNYGGSAIYLGGEDILAFLPIAYNDGEQIKSLALLIKDLDRDFHETLGKYAKEQGVKVPTLSYGLMLAYYKFPMREAMTQAHIMLKKCKDDDKLFVEKNGVSVRFQKHSGQYTECFIDKSKTKSTEQIFELLTSELKGKDKKDTLSGLIQRLKDELFFATFIHAVRYDRVDAFISNFFNEKIHEDTKSTFLKSFATLTKALKQDYLTENKDKEEAENKQFKEILFTVLRYYEFIQPKNKQAK